MAVRPTSKAKPFHLSKDLQQAIQSWSRLWGVPKLSKEIKVRFNARLRSTVARFLSDRNLVEVGPRFLSLRSKHREILCHELAHAAANKSTNADHSPHGVDWAKLVRSAGFNPSARLNVHRTPSRKTKSRGLSYEHRCLVCQFVRMARRPVYSWRCPECVRCGLSGELTVKRSYLRCRRQ